MQSVKEILNAIGYTQVTEMGDRFRMKPLYRDSGNPTSLSVDKKTGQWYDFSECIGGGIDELVRITLDLPDLDKVKELLGDTSKIIAAQDAYLQLSIPKVFDKSMLTKLIPDHSYWINRGISAYTMEMFRGGIATSGRMKNRYVFPIFSEDDKLVGFSGRYLYKQKECVPKWKHISAKKNWTYPIQYNEAFLKETKSVILVESIGDLLSLWDAGVKNVLVLFGVSMSKAILKLLLKLDVSNITIALNNDSDENGFVGNRASEEIKDELLHFFDPEQVKIKLPTEKDFGEMSRGEMNLWK